MAMSWRGKRRLVRWWGGLLLLSSPVYYVEGGDGWHKCRTRMMVYRRGSWRKNGERKEQACRCASLGHRTRGELRAWNLLGGIYLMRKDTAAVASPLIQISVGRIY